MNLLILHESDFVDIGRVKISGRRFQHVVKVIQPELGQSLRVGRLNGLMGSGKVVAITTDTIEMAVSLCESPPQGLGLKLLIALPRPKNLSRILQIATQLGVKDIHFFHSYQVEKSFWTSDYLSAENIEEACLLGLEQARDTLMPKVSFHRWFKPFVEDVVPTLCQQSMKMVAHPVAENNAPVSCNEPVSLAIGPEGGFIDYEVNKFREADFQVIRLGQRILKVDVAVAALISRLYT